MLPRATRDPRRAPYDAPVTASNVSQPVTPIHGDSDPPPPPAPDAAANPADPSPVPTGHTSTRYCAACCYDLRELPAGPCPECGRPFDPAQPDTFITTLTQSPLRRRLRRISYAVLIILALAASLLYNLVPLPVSGHDWQFWRWLGMNFGVSTTWVRQNIVRTHWWADNAYKAQGYTNNQSRRLWELDAPAQGEWSLRVLGAGASRHAIFAAFNTMKPDVFCVRLSDHDLEFSQSQGLEARGTRVDILSAIVDYFGIRIEPLAHSREQQYCWYFDDHTRRMAVRKVEREELATFRWAYEFQGRPLVPRELARDPGDPPTHRLIPFIDAR